VAEEWSLSSSSSSSSSIFFFFLGSAVVGSDLLPRSLPGVVVVRRE